MLRIWRPSGEQVAAFPLLQCWTVKQLKIDLQKLVVIPWYRQRLVYGCKILDNDELDVGVATGLYLLDWSADHFSDLQPLVTPFLVSPKPTRRFVEAAAARFDFRNFNRLLERCHDPNSAADLGGECVTALQNASRHGRLDKVRLLLEVAWWLLNTRLHVLHSSWMVVFRNLKREVRSLGLYIYDNHKGEDFQKGPQLLAWKPFGGTRVIFMR